MSQCMSTDKHRALGQTRGSPSTSFSPVSGGEPMCSRANVVFT